MHSFVLTSLDACLYCHVAADYNLVALRIPKGDRPLCEEIHLMKAEGLKKMVDLMKRCWEKNPSNRPTFKGRSINTHVC